MERRVLSQEELSTELEVLPGWEAEGNELVRHEKFENFAEALAFVNKVGEIAEAADHHPDIKFGWGFAEIRLTTHDRGGVTDVDLAVARKISAF
ncbi:MAG TPA: 4a-hydroxytetrahydrobiopterin dehydratase [Pyrinomonadaceae bacterium]|nr:4a-hydroxytetrahydrobiopterin dehydratase [Pyrinomonadaceae bacterium]